MSVPFLLVPLAARPGGAADPCGLAAALRLVEAGDDRYAIGYWAINERRPRHLEAIASSFKPGRGWRRQAGEEVRRSC